MVLGGSLVRASSWPSTFFLLLTCLPFLLADSDGAYVAGGGILLVLGIDVCFFGVILLVYYFLIATDTIKLRKIQEEDDETSRLLQASSLKQEDSTLESTTTPFPTEWRAKENPFIRFFAYWASWWPAVVRASQECVLENAGLFSFGLGEEVFLFLLKSSFSKVLMLLPICGCKEP